jgi:N-acetylneuraminic acid mutarotase
MGYLRFDISGLVGQPTQPMKLRLWGVSSQSNTIQIPVGVTGADSVFDASTLTYNTRPALIGGVLGTFKLTSTGKYYEVDVSSFVQAELAAGHTNVTFAVQATSGTDPYGKINGFAATSNKPELVPGTVTVPTPQPQPISWSSKAKLVVKREEAQAFSSGGYVYVLGGYYNGSFQANQRVDRYDPKANTWKQMANMPSKMTHAGTAVDPVTGKVWFVAGFIGDFPAPQGTATVRVYNPATDTWSTGPSLPQARGAGGAAIVGRTLYFFGGSTANRQEDRGNTWSLDLDDPNATWQSKADMPNPRNHFGYATVNGKIYVIGGQQELENDAVNQNEVDVYDPTTDSWSTVAMLPKPLSHFHATTSVYKGRYILTAGGENPHETAQSSVYLFDTVTNKWSALTSLPAARRAAAGAIVGDTYVVSGGYLRSTGQTYDVYTADLTKLALP